MKIHGHSALLPFAKEHGAFSSLLISQGHYYWILFPVTYPGSLEEETNLPGTLPEVPC